jgi:ABC-type Fe3+ transport system permease subunit
MVLLVLSIIGIGLAAWLLRRSAFGDSQPGDSPNAGAFNFPPSWQTMFARTLGWTAATLPFLALVFVLARTATGPEGSLAVWRTTWITAREEFFFTTGIGLLTALFASVIGLGLGSALAAMKPSWLLRVLVAAPIVIPGPLYGISMQILLRRPPDSLPFGIDNVLADLSRTTGPLILAWCVQFAPIMALMSERLLRAVPNEEREAALLDGASLPARWKALYWPAVWPGVAAGALVVFALTLGEEGAAVLLLPPGPTTLGVRLLTLMHYAPTGQVSALCLLMMAPGVLAFVLAAGFVFLRQRL